MTEGSQYASKPREVYEFNIDGTLLRYTSYHLPITANLITYNPQPGLKRNAFSVLNTTREPFIVSVPITSELAQKCCLLLTPRLVTLTFKRYQADDLNTLVYTYTGDLQQVSVDGLICQLKFPNVFENALSTSIPKFVTQPMCNWRLGDRNCKKDVAPFIISLSQSRISMPSPEEISFNAIGSYTGPDFGMDLLKGGVVETDTLGYKEFRTITEVLVNGAPAVQTDITPLAKLRLSYGLQIYTSDTTFIITPGCDNLANTCNLRWGNYFNFGGFPRMPTEKANPITTDFSKGNRR